MGERSRDRRCRPVGIRIVAHFAVGRPISEMPLFLTRENHVRVPNRRSVITAEYLAHDGKVVLEQGAKWLQLLPLCCLNSLEVLK